MFFDDDMIAEPDLVRRHLAAHEDGKPTAVVGCCWPARRSDNWVSEMTVAWFNDHVYKGMATGSVAFLHLATAQLSIPKDELLELGGFGTDLPYGHEDWEFGVRWLRSGDGITYQPAESAATTPRAQPRSGFAGPSPKALLLSTWPSPRRPATRGGCPERARADPTSKAVDARFSRSGGSRLWWRRRTRKSRAPTIRITSRARSPR